MSQPRILVVEDEAIVARDIQQQLAARGLQPVGRASRADEAVTLAGELRPDLVLMDIQLAGNTDGIEAAQTIHEKFGIPVIFLTAFVGERILDRAKRAEPSGYIVKPFNEQELFTAIELALHRHQTEAQLRRSHAEQAAILRTALDAFWVVDASGRLIEVNEAACRVTGFTREELLGMSLADLMPGRPADAIAATMRQIMQAGSARFERQHRCKDGRLMDVEVSVNYLPDGGGRFFCFHRDITARKEMERWMLDTLNYSRVMLDHSPAGIITYTAEGRAVSANAAAARVLGATVEQIQAQNFRELASWRDCGLLAAAERTLATGEEQTLEVHFITTFGKEVWLNCHLAPFTHEGKAHLMLMFTSVAPERRAEKQMRLQGTALEAAANAIAITDRRGVIQWVNAAFTKITGYSFAEAIGQNPRLLKSGRHEPGFYREMWETIRAGQVWQGEIYNRRKDGSIYAEEMTITPVKDDHGELTHFIAVKQDITQRKALQEQFRQAQKMEAFGQLAGGVAHDFNNILAVIMMQVGMLQSASGHNGDVVNLAREIGQAAQRGADLTRQLLLFSRRQTLNTMSLNLNESVANLTKMLRRIVGEHIQIQIKPAPEPAWVKADPGMLDQVLMNLVVNARDAMPRGGDLLIETSAVELDEEAARQFSQGQAGSFVCLAVSDTGSGIAAEHLPRIFEPFFTTKEVGKGTGLGLATVFGIVQQHQGWVNVSSEVGRGSTFRVYFPRLAEAGEANPRPATDLTPHAGHETILVVEDEKPLRLLVRNALTRLGYRVLEAANGPEARELWRQHGGEVHLLITDLVMPGGVNGKELAQDFCQERPGLKVIYVSGYSTDVAGTDLVLEDGVNFLSKPFVLSKLAETLRRRLDGA